MILVSVAWLFAVTALIYRALRQRRDFHEIGEPVTIPGVIPSVCVIVPARNEEHNIGPCVKSLLAQDYPRHAFSLIVIDDNSEDRTADAIQSLIAQAGQPHLLRAPALPAGWTGKSRACAIAAAEAEASDWLCFIDADITAEPSLISSAVSVAVAEGLDFLSLTPRQMLLTFSERLILPCGLYLLAFCQNLKDVNSSESLEATATGQFILIRNSAYKSIGGHAAVRDQICEDLALARLARKEGFKVALFGGPALLTTRMYTGWSTLWAGISKNLVEMLGGIGPALLTAAAGPILAWAAPVVPLVDANACSSSVSDGCVALFAAVPASAAVFAFHLCGAAFFRIPLWYGLIFPAGYTLGAALAIDSIRRRLSGKVSWKGRVYR